MSRIRTRYFWFKNQARDIALTFLMTVQSGYNVGGEIPYMGISRVSSQGNAGAETGG
jgi:hypothetical protein